jgi:hypothetical protein
MAREVKFTRTAAAVGNEFRHDEGIKYKNNRGINRKLHSYV